MARVGWANSDIARRTNIALNRRSSILVFIVVQNRGSEGTRGASRLPFGHRPVLQEDPRHWLRAAEWVLGQSRLGEIKSQPWFFGQRVLAVHHAHRREAKPFEPHLVARLRHDIAAELLDQA